MEPKITVYRRRGAGKDDPFPWQADVYLSSGENHHGIGASPAEAMLNAATHWKAHETPTT